MFAVYNNGSVGFRSTSDNLYNLKNIDEVSETRLKPDEGFMALLNQSNNENKKSEQKALNTYKKMANIDTLEPVFLVKDIMTKDCIYIDAKSTIQEAYDVLKGLKIEQLPVVSFAKKILGVINKKVILNLLMEDLENNKTILSKRIEDIYLPQLITSDPMTDIRSVAKVMLDFKLHAIPIVAENDILIGIVTKTDILKAIAHNPKLQLWS
ncbi:CBS domain-containing protein [Arcobacter cloacae]|uniref:CBS domain-containing protein n=1 Tax=Arcobacter cloacae TaxID=1054034 RepID=A0A6M8N5C9_9BACT|nr:CBS domain-containing protein [Arcobacter cloacae]NCB11897.1 CBS domain-containing protein [Erysipelotrichia bacterium]QKF89278.1 CBS domain-containing protein [Arcobacter cloacae]RXI39002.1 CBS domain-containing protein [Arcobacter cloacae]